MSKAVALQEIKEAFYVWEEQSTLTFKEVTSESQADIKLLWGAGEHGDKFPFDGNSAVVGGENELAHTFAPFPQSAHAGQIHFDDDEVWVEDGWIRAGIDLRSVAIHEIGHVLGLDHSTATSSVMKKEYGYPEWALYDDDLQAIWKLYGKPYNITGPTGVQTPATKSYTIDKKIPEGARVQWSAYPANSATIQSGQGTGTATFNMASNTLQGIDATIIFKSGKTWKCERLYVASSPMPVVTNIDIFQYMQGPGEYSMIATVSDPNAKCYWSSSGEIIDLPYPDDAIFATNPGRCAAVRFSGNGEHVVSCYAVNDIGCGPSFSKTIKVTNISRSYKVALSPNPATSGYVNVRIEKQAEAVERSAMSGVKSFKIELWSTSGLAGTWNTAGAELRIPLDGLASGYYFIHVVAGDERYKQVLIVQ